MWTKQQEFLLNKVILKPDQTPLLSEKDLSKELMKQSQPRIKRQRLKIYKHKY